MTLHLTNAPKPWSSGGQTRIWRPEITENPEMRAAFSGNPPAVDQRPYKVSLEHHSEQRAPQGFNSSAMPFDMDPRVKHLQYNTPMGLYSQQNVTESYNQQTAALNTAHPSAQQADSQPAYLRSETLRLLKEQESGRGAPSLSSHPNPSGLPTCFVCTRPILGMMAQAAGHTVHGDCLSCATCGNSLRNIGHHFIDSDKFYCEIHGRQKRGLGGVALDPNMAVRSSPSAAQPKRVEEGVRGFYQPEVLSRRALSPQPPQVNVHVGTPKTHGPISPSNRGVPSAATFYDRRPVSPCPLPSMVVAPPPTIPAPAPPVQAPPSLPANPPPGSSCLSTSGVSASLSVVLSESRVPNSVRDAVSPRRAARAPRPWPPAPTPTTNRYWQIDPAGQAARQKEQTPSSLQEMVKMDDLDNESKETRKNKKVSRHQDIENITAPTTVSEVKIQISKPEITSGIHWTIVTGPKSPQRPNVTKIHVEHVEEKEEKTEPQPSQIEEELPRPTVLPIQLQAEPSKVDSSTSPIPIVQFERQRSVERRLPCTSSPTPFQAPSIDPRPSTPPIIRIEGLSPIPSSRELGDGGMVGINTPPRPFGGCLKKAKPLKRVDFSKTEIIPSPVWDGEVIDESDMLTDTSRHSDDSNDEPRISYDGDESTATKSEDEEENEDFLDEQERWIREELELAAKEELDLKKLETRWKEQKDDNERAVHETEEEMREEDMEREEDAEKRWKEEAVALLNDDEQNERDMEVVAALHERLSGLKEMEDADRHRAIECIERHQRSLEEQQEQLAQLLQSTIQYLRTMEPAKPPTPPPRNESIFKADGLNDALAELEAIPLPLTPAEKIGERLRKASPQMFSRSTFDRTIEKTNGVRSGVSHGVSQGTTSSLGGRIPYCEACKQQIKGAFVLATGLAWCPEHFVCANRSCGRRLLECGFVEENGQKYCEGCFENHIAPRCAKCTKPITSDCLNALHKKWHPTCFTCAHCHKPFGNSAFYLENGQPYCEQDWNQLFTTKCVSCKYPIEAGDRWVEALGSAFHSNCFNCARCHTNLEGESFYAKNGQPYCKMHA